MKRIFYFLSLCVIISLSILSCKSELDLDKTLKFSKLNVEDQKQKLEDNGIRFIERAEGLKDTRAFNTITDFGKLEEVMFVPEMNMLKSAMIETDSKSVLKLHEQVVQRAEDDVWGEYTWNESILEFEKTGESNGTVEFATYHFPADNTDSGNNATFTITYKASNVEIPEEEIYFPEEVTISLKAYDEVLIDGEFTCEYETDDTPSKMNSSLVIEDYSWKLFLTNNKEEINEEYSIEYKKDILMKISSKAKGIFDYDVMENADDPSVFIDEVALSFQVMDIAIMGGIKDINTFVDAMNEIDYEDTRNNYDQQCEIINNHLILYAYFTDDNRKFADVEFYVNEDSNSYEDYVWNGSDYELTMYSYTYYEIIPRLVLSDGSKVDLENYFENGFDELIDKMDSSIEDLN